MATATVPKNRHLRMECPGCGMIARASRTAVLKHGLPAHCGRPMHPDDLDLAAEVLPLEEQTFHPKLQDARRLEENRARRMHRRAGRNGAGRPQCAGCRTFLKAHNAHCSRCGFDNAAGCYREGSSRYDHDLPF